MAASHFFPLKWPAFALTELVLRRTPMTTKLDDGERFDVPLLRGQWHDLCTGSNGMSRVYTINFEYVSP